MAEGLKSNKTDQEPVWGDWKDFDMQSEANTVFVLIRFTWTGNTKFS